MTPLEARKEAFKWERNNPGKPLSVAWMQGYLYAKEQETPIFVDDSPIEVNDFNMLWNVYDRKDNKQSAIKAWRKLSSKERSRVFAHVEGFVKAHPDKKYRPMLATYLNQKRFNDEEIINGTEPTNENQLRFISYANAIAGIKG